MGSSASLMIVGLLAATAAVLLLLAAAMPSPNAPSRPRPPRPVIPGQVERLGVPERVARPPRPARVARSRRFDEPEDQPRLRMLSRLLFTRNQPDVITLDCLVVSVEEPSPGIDAPAGQPFTLQLRAPETAWFAERVEHLLIEWADDNRELLVELSEDHGRVRTMLASNGSTVHLELSGAAGLHLSS